MNFCVVGAGAWGTAFGLHLARLGHAVALVPRRPEHAAELAAGRENAAYLPGVPLSAGLRIEARLPEGLAGAEAVFLACPAQAVRATAGRLRSALGPAAAPGFVVSLVKGLELESHLPPSQVLAGELPRASIGCLAGPTNAAQVARGLPSAVVLAAAPPGGTSPDPLRLSALQAAVSGPTLRVYTSGDILGVEYGGALKNIYAIAAGCCDGLRLGDNAKAALLTRALAEMVRVGAALGARPETFYGLSGHGDLTATCYGAWSRNRELGQRMGEGVAPAEWIAGRRTVAEGYLTARSFARLCADRSIDAPILREVNALLFEGRRPADALAALMSRGLKPEA